MRLSPDDLVQLVAQVEALHGECVMIHESLSRNRDRGGHDRHFATVSRFRMTIDFVGWRLSGSQLTLMDDTDQTYGINTHSITDWQIDEHGTLEIVEQFETRTERRTHILRAAYVAERTQVHAAFLEYLAALRSRPDPPAA